MSMLTEFGRVTSNAEIWVKELAKHMDGVEYEEAFTAFQAVSRALRDRLPVDEAANLGAQLPVLLAGYYYKGWTPANTPTKERSKKAFLESVQENVDNLGHTLDSNEITEPVLALISEKISDGEAKAVLEMMPDELKELWPEMA